MAGGTTDGFLADASPGAGEWRGCRIQVALRPPVQLETLGASLGAWQGASPVEQSQPFGEFDVSDYPSVVVVTTRVAEFTRRLRAIDPPIGDVRPLAASRAGAGSVGVGSLEVVSALSPTIVVGDPDGWQANWALLGALRAGGLVLIDRCSVAEFRAISGRRTLPPPIRVGVDDCWAIEPDGTVRRMRAPSA